jgi:hypothetical protein
MSGSAPARKCVAWVFRKAIGVLGLEKRSVTRAPTTVNWQRGSRGFVIVFVLWMLAALAALASIYAGYVSKTTTVIAVLDERFGAEQLVYAGLEFTAHQVTAVPQNRPSHGAFSFRLDPNPR